MFVICSCGLVGAQRSIAFLNHFDIIDQENVALTYYVTIYQQKTTDFESFQHKLQHHCFLFDQCLLSFITSDAAESGNKSILSAIIDWGFCATSCWGKLRLSVLNTRLRIYSQEQKTLYILFKIGFPYGYRKTYHIFFLGRNSHR